MEVPGNVTMTLSGGEGTKDCGHSMVSLRKLLDQPYCFWRLPAKLSDTKKQGREDHRVQKPCALQKKETDFSGQENNS